MLLLDGSSQETVRPELLARGGILTRIWAKWGTEIQLLLVLGVGFLVRTANPDAEKLHDLSEAAPVFVLALVGTAFFAGLGLHHPKRDNPFDLCLVAPGALLLGFTIAVRWLHGVRWEGSPAWPAGLFFFCLALILFPYLDNVVGLVRPTSKEPR
jgi:hypothetical protein